MNNILNWDNTNASTNADVNADTAQFEPDPYGNVALKPAARPNPLPFAADVNVLQQSAQTLPPIVNLATALQELPPRATPLIDGLLRKGHKMIIAGPSKIGKSHALIDLAIAVAEGRDFLGFDCRQGRVLYINFEIDSNSFYHRFSAVYDARGIAKSYAGNVDILNLRGYAVPLDVLVNQVVDRVHETGKTYDLIVLDPIYKLLTGDENAATDVARFCAQLDRLCAELDCSVVYCHHHSKGAQGMKSSIDRASGSGVFSRDADAILDLSPLRIRTGELDVVKGQLARAILKRVATESGVPEPDAKDKIEDALAALSAQIGDSAAAELQGEIGALIGTEAPVALRLTATLREFAQPAPKNMLFAYPITLLDETGLLADCLIDGEIASAEQKRQAQNDSLEAAFAQVTKDGRTASVQAIADVLGVTAKTARKHIADHPGFRGDGKGHVIVADKADDQDEDDE